MISIPGSLSPLSSSWWCHPPLQNLPGMPDTRPKIYSFIDCSTQSRLQSVLGMRFSYVERNYKLLLTSPYSFNQHFTYLRTFVKHFPFRVEFIRVWKSSCPEGSGDGVLVLSRIHLHCTRRFIRTTVARRGYALTEKYRKTDLLKQHDT